MVSRKPRPVNKNKGTGPRKPGIRDWPIWEGRFTDLGDRPGEYFRYRFEGPSTRSTLTKSRRRVQRIGTAGKRRPALTFKCQTILSR